MSNLKEQLILSLKTAVEENERKNIKLELRSLITRSFPDKETLDRVNGIYSINHSPTQSLSSKKYKVFTPDLTKKKKASLKKVVVVDDAPERIKSASDDLSIESIEVLIKDDEVEKEFGSIEAFKQYTEERFGVKYGRRTAKESVLNHFIEHIAEEEDL